MCYIALGIVEAYYIEGPGISTWDIAAASLIISEAGGVVVDRITGGHIFSKSHLMFKLFRNNMMSQVIFRKSFQVYEIADTNILYIFIFIHYNCSSEVV